MTRYVSSAKLYVEPSDTDPFYGDSGEEPLVPTRDPEKEARVSGHPCILPRLAPGTCLDCWGTGAYEDERGVTSCHCTMPEHDEN